MKYDDDGNPVGTLPEIHAALPDGAEGDYREFDQMCQAMDKLLTQIENGKYASAEALASVQKDLEAIRKQMTEAFGKSGDLESRILSSVRDTTSDMLRHIGGVSRQVEAPLEARWVEVEAGVREQGHHSRAAELMPGRGSTVLYADMRPPAAIQAQRLMDAMGIRAAAVDTSGGGYQATGAGVTALAPWVYFAQGNPFSEFSYIVYPANPAFTIPRLPRPTKFTENRAATAGADNLVGGSVGTQVIDIAADTERAIMFEKKMSYPLVLADDLMMLQEMVGVNVMMVGGGQWGEKVASVLKAKALGQEVKTGLAAKLPTVDNFPAVMARMLKSVRSFYRMGAAWMLNESVEELWNSQWSKAGASINPEMGRGTLLGFPVRINSHLDSGAAANDVSAYFGNYRLAIVEAIFREFEVRYYLETAPGDMTVYSCFRAQVGIANSEAVSRLVTKA